MRFVVLVAQIHLFEDRLDEVATVRRLVDREGLREADTLGLDVQNARENRVERSHTDVAALAPGDHLLDTLAHFGSGFVCEREGEDRMGRDTLFDHISDAGGKHSGFARASTRYDERGGVVIDHSRPLCGIQPRKNFRLHIDHKGTQI